MCASRALVLAISDRIVALIVYESVSKGVMNKTLSTFAAFLPLWPVLSFLDANKNESGLMPSWFAEIALWYYLALGFFYLLVRTLRGEQSAERATLTALVITTFASFHFNIKMALGLQSEAWALGIWASLAIIIAVAVWFLMRIEKARNALGLFAAYVCLSSIGALIYDSGDIVWMPSKQEMPARYREKTVPIEAIAKADKPNVYVFIFDAYMRSDWLARAYGFDNSAHLNALEQAGFFTARESRSTFPVTRYSINAFLNPDLTALAPKDMIEKLHASQSYTAHEKGSAQRQFEAMGYTVAMRPHTGAAGTACDPYCLVTRPPVTLMQVQYAKTLPVYDFLKRFFPGEVWRWLASVPNDPGQSLDHMPEGLPAPYVLISHLMIPHPPYAREADCSMRMDADFEYEGNDSSALDIDTVRTLYLNQIQCANKRMLAIAKRLETADPNALVLFVSDHGWKSHLAADETIRTNPDTYRAHTRFSNFWAAKLPAACQDHLSHRISFPDTLPVVQACLRGDNPSFMPYKAYSVGRNKTPIDETPGLQKEP